MKFLLDTDHLVILQRRSQPEWTHLRRHLAGCQQTDVCLSSVSFHEQVLAANTYINRAKSQQQVVKGYEMLERCLADFQNFMVLAFDDLSASLFESFRSQGIRIGTMDLRIGSVALRNGLTLLTRNSTDFEKVPGLRIVDWTRA